MAHVKTTVEILNNSLTVVATIKNLYPIDKQGNVLRYSKVLSDYGDCTFRVSTKDPLYIQFGDVIEPHRYHVRIKRGTTVVWQGTIVDNPSRNKNYQEILAHQYLYYFDKILVKRTSEAATGEGFNYRNYTTGTMTDNLVTTLNEMKDTLGTNHILSGMVVSSGNMTNPNYPAGMTNTDGTALTGAWSFNASVQMQFDYHSILFVIQSFANYSQADFEIDNDLTFRFAPFIGNKQLALTFVYGVSGLQGNIIDYDIPRYGRRMANETFGIAADSNGKVLYESVRDTDSVNSYGLLQSATAFTDVKTDNLLKQRVAESLRFTKTPDAAPINLTLNEKGYPLGQYDVGDIVTVIIKDHSIDFSGPRRIVKATVTVHNTGRELTTIQTNKPRDSDLGL